MVKNLIFDFIESWSMSKNLEDVVDYEKHVKLNALELVNEKELRLNPNSKRIIETLLELVVNHSGESHLPANFDRAIKMSFDFHQHIRDKFGKGKNYLEFKELFHHLEVRVLQQVETSYDLSVIDFASSLLDCENVESHLYRFERRFLEYVSSKNDLSDSFIAYLENAEDKEQRYYVMSFVLDIGTRDPEYATSLLTKISKKPYREFYGNLIASLINAGKDHFSKVEEIIKKNPKEGFRVLCLVTINSDSISNKLKNFIDPNLLPDSYGFQSTLIVRLIDKEHLNAKGVNDLFETLEMFIDQSDEKVSFEVIDYVSLGLREYEKRKYDLLIKFLKMTKQIHVVERFFLEFKDPGYLFELMKTIQHGSGGRINLKHFCNAIGHFWGVNREKTEVEIIGLFDHSAGNGFLPAEVILSQQSPLPVDLLKLSERDQIQAVNCLSQVSHWFEKIVGLLVTLRKSKYPDVVKHLQDNLLSLVYWSYPTLLMNWLEKNCNDRGDKKFLKPIQEAHAAYHEMSKKKGSINDLDPLENERKYVELYFRLETENMAKVMKKAGEGSFMNMMKNVAIVRGKSWKVGDEIRPLGHFSSEFWQDAMLFKNPEMYELSQEQFR